jgi:hypothetical protein
VVNSAVAASFSVRPTRPASERSTGERRIGSPALPPSIADARIQQAFEQPTLNVDVDRLSLTLRSYLSSITPQAIR